MERLVVAIPVTKEVDRFLQRKQAHLRRLHRRAREHRPTGDPRTRVGHAPAAAEGAGGDAGIHDGLGVSGAFNNGLAGSRLGRQL